MTPPSPPSPTDATDTAAPAADRPAPIHAVMFDLDGTLADTLTDLAEAGNRMRATFGLDPLPTERYRTLVGRGAPYLARQTVGLSEDDPRLDDAVRQFRADLLTRNHPHTTPYAGIPALLDALQARGLPMAVLSNKPDDSTRPVVERVFANWDFAHVRGHVPDTAPKPDAEAALTIARRLGIAADHWLYVGDSDVDMQTGRNAGMTTVGVTWGFRDEQELRDNGAHHIIHEPGELLAIIDANANSSAK